MFDCASELLAFHNEEVSLPQAKRTEMKERRDANRKRLLAGLEEAENPKPIEFASQGSYAMKTMVQAQDNDYDIDDGVYYQKTDLIGPRGGEMSTLEVRQMIRDAVDDGSFKEKPSVKKHCVRVHYDAGYHVDIPIYRDVGNGESDDDCSREYELASTDWKQSDARHVTEWFERENERLSPDKSNGRQLRRMCRFIKKFASSRESWKKQVASGFAISKLVTECYRPNLQREDVAFRDTIQGIRNRLNLDLVVPHPTLPGETISKGADDPKIRFLLERLSDALRWLEPTDQEDCTKSDALSAWDKVFATSFFTDQMPPEEDKGGGQNALKAGLISSAADAGKTPVKKGGGGRYA